MKIAAFAFGASMILLCGTFITVFLCAWIWDAAHETHALLLLLLPVVVSASVAALIGGVSALGDWIDPWGT